MTQHKTPANTAPVALVTGAGQRIGAVLARRLAAEGTAVLIHYRASAEPAEALCTEITAAGGRAAPVAADLAVRSQRARLIDKAGSIFGPVTILVNNASSFSPDAIADLDEALWDTHFAIHAEAPVFLARDFAAQLPGKTLGNIINIIDERVLHLSPAYLSYTLSKSVLWTATRTLAQSLAPGIRVNAIGPGPTLPHSGQSETGFERSVAELPLKRGATPEDIADAMMFILHASSFTGQMLALDGGRHIGWPEQSGPTPARP